MSRRAVIDFEWMLSHLYEWIEHEHQWHEERKIMAFVNMTLESPDSCKLPGDKKKKKTSSFALFSCVNLPAPLFADLCWLVTFFFKQYEACEALEMAGHVIECSIAAYLRQRGQHSRQGEAESPLPRPRPSLLLMWLQFIQRALPVSGSLGREQLPEWSTNHPISPLSCRALISQHACMLLAHSRLKPWVIDTEQETQREGGEKSTCNFFFPPEKKRQHSSMSRCQRVVLYISSPMPLGLGELNRCLEVRKKNI